MSIALGLITNEGKLIAASDGLAQIAYKEGNESISKTKIEKEQEENFDKTFSLFNNQLIGAYTGAIAFNGNTVGGHLQEFITKTKSTDLQDDTISNMMEYLKEQLKEDVKFNKEARCIFIVFLYYKTNIPYLVYYHIVPDVDVLKISDPDIYNTTGNKRIIGNGDVANEITNLMNGTPNNANNEVISEIMIQAVVTTDPDDCNSNIFTQNILKQE